MDFQYKDVFIDIINVCNARCPYCLTGAKNRSGENKSIKSLPMDTQYFCQIMDHLLKNRIIVPNAWIGLYNWYEPMLNPYLPEIIQAAKDRNLEIGLSTNASVLPDLNQLGQCEHITEIIYSMCGFSQQSYDKIHGLCFKTITDNIRTSLSAFRKHGFQGSPYIHFHVYQFNINEVHKAKKFADSINLPIKFTYAYFNNDEFRPYLDGTMTSERLKEVSKDLFFCYLDDLFDHIDYYDAQFKEEASLTISERGNLILNRNVNDDDAICSVFSVFSGEEARRIMEQHDSIDEMNRKIRVWGQTFNMSINHLFGYECNVPNTIKPLPDQQIIL